MLCAFDGTWNTVKTNDETGHTNVWRFYRAYQANNRNQWDFYWPGVGTRLGVPGKLIGGAFGAGALERLNEAYGRVCAAWEAGERVIDVVGFSRGGAMALDFCNILQERKIRKPVTGEILEPEPTIRFLGVWDVVGAFGIACLGATHLNIGHHLHLPKANLKYAFHALALDERRPSFLPTRLNGAYEVWFRGVHSDVGGGNDNPGLNDIGLLWMFSKARAAGLPITNADVEKLEPEPRTKPKRNSRTPIDTRLVGRLDRRHHTVGEMVGCRIPPDSCPVETPADETQARELGVNQVSFLSDVDRDRIKVLLTQAERTAEQLDYSLDGVRDGLTTLIQGRIPLVTNNAELQVAKTSVATLVDDMVQGARRRHFCVLHEFFLTEALFHLHPLFPFSD
jgi:hypothetical protein